MLVSNQIWQDHFKLVFQYPNVEAVTLKLKPIYWGEPAFQELFEKDFTKYCDHRNIDYVLVAERGENNNLHYHGIIGYPYQQQKKRFQCWFNKYFGKIHVSSKADPQGWEDYIYKSCPLPVYSDCTCVTDDQAKVPYLFDPGFEPLESPKSLKD